ncbi:MAG TPA: DUF881 domain-containing protein [Thermoleophilia bacterium]|nr:DUF881 domain-containing protein [Thermoleophilia bacterium]
MSARSKTAWGLFLTFAVLGFMLVTQARVQDNRNRQLDLQSVEELTTLVGTLSQENDRLQEEVTELRLLAVEDRFTQQDRADSLVEQERTLGGLRLLNGVIASSGPGVLLELRDPLRELHAYELAQVVNELKSAGAEAIIVNERRLSVRSAFGNFGEQVTLDGIVLAAPYEVEALGEPDTLDSSMVMAGGVIPTLEGRLGVSVEIVKMEELQATRLENLPKYVQAAPSREDGDGDG